MFLGGDRDPRDLLADRSPVPLRAALEFGFDAHDGVDDRALARWWRDRRRSAVRRALVLRERRLVHLGQAIETVTEAGPGGAMPRLLAGPGCMRRGPAPVAAWQVAESVPAPQRVVPPTLDARWFDAWGLGLGRLDSGRAEVSGWDGVVDGQRSGRRPLPDRTVQWSSSRRQRRTRRGALGPVRSGPHMVRGRHHGTSSRPVTGRADRSRRTPVPTAAPITGST